MATWTRTWKLRYERSEAKLVICTYTVERERKRKQRESGRERERQRAAVEEGGGRETSFRPEGSRKTQSRRRKTRTTPVRTGK